MSARRIIRQVICLVGQAICLVLLVLTVRACRRTPTSIPTPMATPIPATDTPTPAVGTPTSIPMTDTPTPVVDTPTPTVVTHTPTPTPGRAADLLAERSQVQCRHPGQAAEDVAVGDHEPVATGDQINTDQTGLGILTFADFLRVEVFRQTGLQVKAAPDPNAPPIVKLYLALGTTLQGLQRKAGQRVDVTTDTDWATIRAVATTYLIAMDDSEITWVVVFDGETEVKAQGQTVIVRTGQATLVKPRKAPEPPFYVEMGPVDDWVRRAIQGEEVGPIESVIVTPTPVPTPTPLTATLVVPEVIVTKVVETVIKEAPPSATPAVAERFSLSIGGRPFDNKSVQEAVGFAINWAALRDEIGEVVLVDFLSGETLAGPTEPAYDPDRAKQLLAEAGYPDGFSTMLLFDQGDELAAKLAEWVTSYLGRVNISTEFIGVAPADARAKLAAMIEAGESGMLIERR